MNIENYKHLLLTHIPRAKLASGNTEIQCRCFYCADSKDSTSDGHMYISIPKDSNDLSLHNCFKCHNGGMVTNQKLMQWGIFDTELAIDLTQHNMRVMSNPIYAIKYNQGIFNLGNSYVTQDELSLKKLQYINNRLGINLSYDDLLHDKIALNINDLLKSNHITDLTRHQNIISQLDSSFVGFISYDNAFLNMRNLTSGGKVYKTIDKRYVNYSIFGKEDNTCKFYVNPCTIDIASPAPIKLHIAEGPFDALSIKYNLRKDFNQTIYSAVTGSGYKGLIRYFITVLKLMNLEIHLYADTDIERYKIIDLVNFLSVYNYPFYLHRNVYPNQKDMGVRIEQINESIERLK